MKRKFKEEPIHFTGRYKTARAKAPGKYQKIFNIIAAPAKSILQSRLMQGLIIGGALIYGDEIKTSLSSRAEKISHLFTAESFDERGEAFNYTAAVHEAGHAVMMLALRSQSGMDIDYITINPRHASDGYRMFKENNDYIGSRNNYEALVIATYGGIAAEEAFFGERTQGVGTDLEYAVTIAENMIMYEGLTDTLIPMGFRSLRDGGLMTQETLDIIVPEVEGILVQAYYTSLCMTEIYKSQIEVLAEALMRDADHCLTGAQIKKILKYNVLTGLPYKNENDKLVHPKWNEDPLKHFRELADKKMEEVANENGVPKPEA